LRINSLRKSDEGTYRCVASNNVGDGDGVVNIYVREQRPTRPPPVRPDFPSVEQVSISPSYHDGNEGEEIILRCSSNPRGRVHWTKDGSEVSRNAQQSGDELIIRYATEEDAGRYECSVHFSSGATRSAYSDVRISSSRPRPPTSNEVAATIQPLESKYTVTQGQDFEITCEASGSPYPTVVWSLVRN
jgi:hypothetical protein